MHLNLRKQTLTSLTLWCNGIREFEAQYLAEALRVNTASVSFSPRQRLPEPMRTDTYHTITTEKSNR